MNVILLGPRASGKTTVGRTLARSIGWSFLDLDDLACAQFVEATVTAIWRVHGEAAWRDAESAALGKVLSDDQQIIALGGGTPTLPAAAALIQSHRQCGALFAIYLHTAPHVLQQRLAAEAGDRPSLTGAHPADEIAAITAQREATYRGMADHVCDTDDRSIEEIAAELARLVATQEDRLSRRRGGDRCDACD